MRRNSFLYKLTKRIAKYIFSLLYQIKIEEEGKLPEQGPIVILPKHQYWTDIPLVSIALKPMLYFVAKRELFRFPIVRDYLSLLGGIPLDRTKTIRSLGSFKAILNLLRYGERIVIFPEGTYFRNELGPPKTGLLQMILKSQKDLNYYIPFVPIGIKYGEKIGWRRYVEIKLGSPLYAKEESEYIFLIYKIMDEIARLSGLFHSSFLCRRGED